MFLLDSLLIGGLRFVLDKIAAAAEAESNDDSSLREQLLEAQLRLELGEISRAEFAVIEKDLLARIRAVKSTRQGPLKVSPGSKISGVEIESYHERG
jgi:hypothetical protein